THVFHSDCPTFLRSRRTWRIQPGNDVRIHCRRVGSESVGRFHTTSPQASEACGSRVERCEIFFPYGLTICRTTSLLSGIFFSKESSQSKLLSTTHMGGAIMLGRIAANTNKILSAPFAACVFLVGAISVA